MPAYRPSQSRSLMIDLLIVIDVRLYREGIAATLAGRPPFAIVDAVGTRAAALEAAKTTRPDVVLVDMAVRDALELIHDLGREVGSAAVVAFAVDEVASD